MYCGLLYFKQKTAYEMRIRDWSSDVCSSDLPSPAATKRQCRQVSLPSPNGSGKLLCQFHLFEIEFDRGCPPEDGDRNLDAVLFEIQFLDRAVEAGERTVQNLDLITDLVIDVDLVLGLSRGFLFGRSEEHTSELQSLMRISYAVFCLKKKNK